MQVAAQALLRYSLPSRAVLAAGTTGQRLTAREPPRCKPAVTVGTRAEGWESWLSSE